MSNLAIFGQLGFCPILVLIHPVHAEQGELHSMWLVLSGPSWTIIHSQYRARCHAAPVLLRDVSQIFHLFWVIFKVIWAMMCLPLTSLRPHGWSWLYRLYPGMWRVMWVMHSNATLEKCHKSHRKNATDENWENIHASYKKSETIEVKKHTKKIHNSCFWAHQLILMLRKDIFLQIACYASPASKKAPPHCSPSLLGNVVSGNAVSFSLVCPWNEKGCFFPWIVLFSIFRHRIIFGFENTNRKKHVKHVKNVNKHLVI